MLKNFLRDETGAELAEYAVGVALLVAIGVVVYTGLETQFTLRTPPPARPRERVILT